MIAIESIHQDYVKPGLGTVMLINMIAIESKHQDYVQPGLGTVMLI